ncbi:MAG: MFS transporter [Flavobacteriales bacterium]|nr:MFS transporter [Flavobacteriales bacterium]MBV6484180.1 Enterobactin exporter EntS [Flavobacteriales bacterium]MBX2959189.1 MFS transporter [Flavobacteriales bacterium]
MSKKDPYAALRFKEFNIFLIVRFALVFAWSMQFIVIEWEVYSLTKDPLSLGLIGLMEVIPALSFALFAGHVVDQKEKRGLLIKCILGFILICLGLFLITNQTIQALLTKNSVVWMMYLLVFFGGVVRAFIGPTVFSLFAQVIPKSEYANAATWSSSVWQIGSVLGPTIAGFAILWVGVNGAMFIVLLFALIALFFLFKIEKKPILNPKLGEPILKSLTEGIKFVYNTKEILGAITLDMVAVLFGGAIALLPIYAQDILEVGPKGFGVLRAAPAIGSFITILAVAYFPLTKNAGIKLLVSIFGFGLSIILFGVSTIFWISLIALFLSGVFDGVSVVIRQTILQIKTPDNMRGRVASVNSMFVGSSNELGAFESGVAAKLLGTVRSVVFGGSMTLLIVLATGIFSPKLRKLDLLSKDEDKAN